MRVLKARIDLLLVIFGVVALHYTRESLFAVLFFITFVFKHKTFEYDYNNNK